MKLIINNLKFKITNFIKHNKTEVLLLILILSVAAFFRLYRISDYMTFLSDEGRDVIIVRRFITELHPPLIGPGTSVGNMYLGPLYYYMMAPALLLANFSPVGPAIQIALLGVVTVFFVWFVGRKWFPSGEKVAWGALIVAGLYAISPTVIDFSRSSWNPNIMPFFSLLSIYSIWKVYESRGALRGVGCWLITLGISYAFVLQSHYLGLLLAPTLFVFWLLTLFKIKNDKLVKAIFVRSSLLAFLLFALLMSPLLIFDIRHNWQNYNAIKIFFTSSRDVGLPLLAYLSKIWTTSLMLFTNLLMAKNMYLGTLAVLVSIIFLGWIYKKHFLRGAYLLLFLWIAVGLIGIAAYRGQIYDHYLGFLFPAPFLLLGAFAQKVLDSKNLLAKILFSLTIGCVVFFSLQNDPPFVNPGYQMPRVISVAKVIQEKAGGAKFNLAAISDFDDRSVYLYFLTIWGARVVDTDPSTSEFTQTDQLFVVCEYEKSRCDPTHSPSAWITRFGWTKIVDEWEVWGGTLYKLGHANSK
ncbi:MAG: glycosyltransferase family 39 protein [Candidatus Woesebacteria bacterium]|nr:MAG: glycosyltransferase family 39 protein [Candidatus Woesebacteria bacterium]